ISKIVYATRDENRGCINLKTRLHPKTNMIGGVLASEAAALLKEFFMRKRNLS
ncbi:nucleoside deaminase, partial [Flavobacteriaceae bacterium]|nr:nucleoside deaminase [Flavobacteriaceae bacterium]